MTSKHSVLLARGAVTVGLTAALVLSGCGKGATSSTSNATGKVKVGLITKTETNPFFVKMKEGAKKAADAAGVDLLTAAGKFDGDNEGQVTAIENMVNGGVKGIMITPTGTDALFATDNKKAGVLIGQYAKAKMAGKPVKIATLDLAPGITVGVLRHDGFLEGFGIKAGDPSIVCSADTQGDQAKGQTGMENCLQKAPDINLVYTINEPAALGAYTAIKAKGREKDVVIVSVDGGCTGVKGVESGQIAATSQQYPLKMAQLGVEAIVKFAKDGTKASGYTDTGVTLIAKEAVAGVDSKDVTYGLDNCWG
jgi:fructose transport system substrate-binding protein